MLKVIESKGLSSKDSIEEHNITLKNDKKLQECIKLKNKEIQYLCSKLEYIKELSTLTPIDTSNIPPNKEDGDEET